MDITTDQIEYKRLLAQRIRQRMNGLNWITGAQRYWLKEFFGLPEYQPEWYAQAEADKLSAALRALDDYVRPDDLALKGDDVENRAQADWPQYQREGGIFSALH